MLHGALACDDDQCRRGHWPADSRQRAVVLRLLDAVVPILATATIKGDEARGRAVAEDAGALTLELSELRVAPVRTCAFT